MKPSKRHIEHFGFYHGFTSDKIGDHIEELADFSSFAHVYIEQHKIERAIEYGLMPVIDLTKILRVEVWEDFKAKFKAFEPIVRDYKREILAFYMYDEPYWNGMTYKDFNRKCRWVKKRWPYIEQWTTFCWKSISSLRVPKFLDRISITPDYNQCPTTIMAQWINSAKTKMHDCQDIVLTMDGFDIGGTGIPIESWQEYKRATINNYWQLAKSDSRITALWTFMWPSHPTGVGVADMLIVRDRLIELGIKIK
jgi:hypothetical protein